MAAEGYAWTEMVERRGKRPNPTHRLPGRSHFYGAQDKTTSPRPGEWTRSSRDLRRDRLPLRERAGGSRRGRGRGIALGLPSRHLSRAARKDGVISAPRSGQNPRAREEVPGLRVPYSETFSRRRTPRSYRMAFRLRAQGGPLSMSSRSTFDKTRPHRAFERTSSARMAPRLLSRRLYGTIRDETRFTPQCRAHRSDNDETNTRRPDCTRLDGPAKAASKTSSPSAKVPGQEVQDLWNQSSGLRHHLEVPSCIRRETVVGSSLGCTGRTIPHADTGTRTMIHTGSNTVHDSLERGFWPARAENHRGWSRSSGRR